MNLKALIEKRSGLIIEADGILKLCSTETRAMTGDETTKYNKIIEEVGALDTTIEAMKKQEGFGAQRAAVTGATTEEEEKRAFAGYIRGELTEQRANLTKTNNGAVIPQSIANMIIEKVEELSNIYSYTTKYRVKGTLTFPIWGADEDNNDENITCGYSDEFVDLTATTGKFTSVSISGHLAGVLTKVSISLVNNSDFDIVSFITLKLAESIVKFLEKELIVGTSGKMTGILSAGVGATAASPTDVTADELIDVQMSIPEVYQTNARWLMHKDTLKKIRKLKDNDGNYLLNRDITTAFGWQLLGKPVEFTETMPKAEAEAKAIVYGDLSGLYVNIHEDPNIQILRENYATQHALGVVGWLEIDSKIIEPQKISVLQMGA